MKEWRVFSAEGSLLVITDKLNEIERNGYAIHSVLADLKVGSHPTHSMWPIVAFREIILSDSITVADGRE